MGWHGHRTVSAPVSAALVRRLSQAYFLPLMYVVGYVSPRPCGLPGSAWCSVAAGACVESELPSQFAIKRIGPAATQSDGKDDQTPQEGKLPATTRAAKRKSVSPRDVKCNDGEFDRDRCREESREQAEDEAYRANGLEKKDQIRCRYGRFDAPPSHTARCEGRHGGRQQFDDAMRQQYPAGCYANERVEDFARPRIEGRKRWDDWLRLSDRRCAHCVPPEPSIGAPVYVLV